jgi:ribosome-binding ATPase YchF (GTP1/OBG family)
MEKSSDSVWIFNGLKGRFPGGVFTDKAIAEKWIQKYKLTGVLTCYPINDGVYDWAIRNNHFTPSKEKEKLSDFIATFSSASQEHYHYIDGNID